MHSRLFLSTHTHTHTHTYKHTYAPNSQRCFTSQDGSNLFLCNSYTFYLFARRYVSKVQLVSDDLEQKTTACSSLPYFLYFFFFSFSSRCRFFSGSSEDFTRIRSTESAQAQKKIFLSHEQSKIRVNFF